MQRSLVQHEIEFTLCVYEAFVKIVEAENYFVSWRIGKQCSQCEKRVQPNQKGKIIFKNELSLKVKMIYDLNNEAYRQKKGFLMLSYHEKGEDKLAGVLTIDLSKQLTEQNRQVQILVQDYLLDKSPDKTAAICIGFRWKLLNQNSMINQSVLSQSISFLNQNRLLLESRQFQSASKQNQDLRHQNQSLKSQIHILSTQIQQLLTTKDHLSQQNKFLRSLHIQDPDPSNSPRRNGLTQQDLQDLKSLDMIRQQCYKLQTVKTQQSQGASYKQQLLSKQTQISQLLYLFNQQKQKTSSLQSLNNILLKQQQQRELKLKELQYNLNKVTCFYEQQLLQSKQSFENDLEKGIRVYREQNQELKEEVRVLRCQINQRKRVEQQKQQKQIVQQNTQQKQQQHTLPTTSSQFIPNITILKQRHILISLISILRSLSIRFSKFKSSILSNFSDLKINKLKQLVSGVNEIERELQMKLSIYVES